MCGRHFQPGAYARTDVVRVLDFMKVKGLVWLGIPADDYAAAFRFFARTLGMDVAFDEGDTVELSAENGDRVQLFGPGHRYFELYQNQGARIVPLFEVDSLEEAQTELIRSSGSLRVQPVATS
jgi:predicted enzyme related to lactoylglutathione lyase